MKTFDLVIVGGGFTGLVVAYELSRQGKKVHVLEADEQPGGLAKSFSFDDGVVLEDFYHHWFNNDAYIPALLEELGLKDRLSLLPTKTGMYFDGKYFNLSTPLDLLRFTPLPFIDRIRLGLLVLRVRGVKDWKRIEHMSIREWLEPLCGKNAYRVVWEPLVNSKFSVFADAINAVWLWNKLVLRGGTRNSTGGEELAYIKGGFGCLVNALVEAIEKNGGVVSTNRPVTGLECSGENITALNTPQGAVHGERFLFTPAFPIIADIFEEKAPAAWLESLRRVRYLGNRTLVLRLRHSLSDIYWLNVNDPGFPFVGVIEHTNFDSPENYNNTHIVYLSQYLSIESPAWSCSDEEYYMTAMGYLKRMFPRLEDSWILEYKVRSAKYAQPVTERGYSTYIPGQETPYKNASIATMAQIYPEDRGTNYAVREARKVARELLG